MPRFPVAGATESTLLAALNRRLPGVAPAGRAAPPGAVLAVSSPVWRAVLDDEHDGLHRPATAV